MRFRIEHTTAFHYDTYISEAYTEMRLRPLDTGGQRCLSFSLVTEPRDEVLSYADRFGNQIHHFDVLQPHNRLVVSAVSDVVTPAGFVPDRADLTQVDEYDYLQPTSLAPFTRELAALGQPGQLGIEHAMRLMADVHQALIYTKGSTTVSTTAAQALMLGKGVCQDYTHIMLAACRANGLPARYVSGYVYIEGRTAATHAWVDVYLAGYGWLSLDPTHNRPQNDHYVRVAVGRDYADVPPTRGVFTGQAKEHMDVLVTMHVV